MKDACNGIFMSFSVSLIDKTTDFQPKKMES